MNEKINTKNDGDLGYLAFYTKKGKRGEVWAKTSADAQKIAAAFWKVKKSYEVSVYLCVRSEGSEVVHTSVD
jgi:hypothetical protein